jgi:LuxR family maltose regulon positive regulatory protein
MSGGACDAVADRSGSAAILEELDRRNLLVVALDAERTWWRYHHLFAELLRRELARTDAARVKLLHRRAAEWHAEHGLADEAIRHSLACGAVDRAGELIAEHWNEAFNRGELASVDAWLRALPPSLVVADERLWLARLWTAMDRGELVEVRALLTRGERAAIPAARSWAPVLHGLHAFKRGDLADAEREIAAMNLSAGDPFRRTTGRLVGGVVAFARGDRAVATEAFTDAADLAAEHENRLGLAYAAGHLALLALEEGRDRDAAQELARVDALLEHDGAVGEHFVAYASQLARGLLAERAAAYDAAATTLVRAVELARRGGGALELASSLVELGRLQWFRAARDDALRLAREARRVLDSCPDPGRVAARLAELELRTEIRRAEPVARDRLSDSELAVLRLLPTGLSNREIGEELYVSINTVKTHLRNLYGKLDAGSREQAVTRARQLGLIDA